MAALIPAALLAAVAVEIAAAGTLANPAIDELSGLAVSRADPGVLWGHNDTGGGAALYRFGPQGEDLGRVEVPGAEAADWEDLAAFDDARGPALLIADVGDNVRRRAVSTLYAVSDPGREGGTSLLWRLDFTWPDGSHDCEAIAVDPRSREILLLTKRDQPARLYRLPLPDRAPPPAPAVAEFLGTLASMPAIPPDRFLASPVRSWFGRSPTAFSISADGLTAAIVTPLHAYVYRRQPGEAWMTLFARGAAPIELPAFFQIEAAALSPDGRTLWVGSEGAPARWARISLP